MHGQMISMYALLFIVLSTFSSSFAYETIKCSPDNYYDPAVYLKYNRNSVGVYQYPDTPSVNFFINESQIFITGGIDNNNRNNKRWVTTEVYGVANTVNVNDHRKELKDCGFFIKDKSNKRVFDKYAIECISTKLCQSLGTVSKDDLARAQANPRFFGPAIDLRSRELYHMFPKMINAGLKQNAQPEKTSLDDAADSIIRMVSNRFSSKRNGGEIKLPNIKHRVFTASSGTFRGVQNLRRSVYVPMRASTPSDTLQMFTFNVIIPEGHVQYEYYKAFGLIPVMRSLYADVQDIAFTATVQMDFGQEYCRPSLVKFSGKSPGATRTYTSGRLSYFTNPALRRFVSVWNTNIVQFIEKEIRTVMAESVKDEFDCEKFRRVLKH